MENYVIAKRDSELYHHGTKGMKWGRRLYQNKDGSLTPLGRKRYSKEVETLKKDKAKLREEKKAASERKKTQTKLDKLEAEKKKVAEQRKALKDGNDQNDKKSSETPEQKKERLLKSTNAKELYDNKDMFTYQELNDRVNRIDLENRLQSKITVEHEKTGRELVNEKMRNTKETIDNVTNLYKSVDNAVSSVANSMIGKTLAKQLGIELPKKEKTFNLDDFVKNIDKKSTQEILEVNKRLIAEDSIKNKQDARTKAKQEAEKVAEAKKQVDDYNERWQKDGVDDKVTNTDSTYSKTGDSEKVGTGSKGRRDMPLLETVEKVSGTVEGEGSSSSKIKNESNKSSTKRTYTDDDIIDMEVSSSSISNPPAVYTSRGQSVVTALLEELR